MKFSALFMAFLVVITTSSVQLASGDTSKLDALIRTFGAQLHIVPVPLPWSGTFGEYLFTNVPAIKMYVIQLHYENVVVAGGTADSAYLSQTLQEVIREVTTDSPSRLFDIVSASVGQPAKLESQLFPNKIVLARKYDRLPQVPFADFTRLAPGPWVDPLIENRLERIALNLGRAHSTLRLRRQIGGQVEAVEVNNGIETSLSVAPNTGEAIISASVPLAHHAAEVMRAQGCAIQ